MTPSRRETMTPEDKAIFVARTISSWEKTDRETISLEAKVYTTFFPTLVIVHTVHDLKTGNPVFILVNRQDAILSAKRIYNLKTKGDPLPGKTEVGRGSL